MREQYAKLLGQIINIGIIALVFIIPILFIPLPQNTNDIRIFAEFNKQIVFVVGSLLLFTLWTLKMLLDKKVIIVRTPADIPMLIFLLVYIGSFAFSIDRFVSVAGFYGLFYPSLVGVFALVLFYFTLVSNLNPKTRFFALGAFVTSMAIVSIINILNLFGVFILPYEAVKVREWTPLLSTGTLAFLASLSIPVSLGLALQSKTAWIKSVWFVFSIILFVPLLIINVFGAWISLLAATVAFLIFASRTIQRRGDRLLLAVAGAAAVFLLIIALTPALRDNLITPLIRSEEKTLNVGPEPKLSLEHGWQVAAGAAGQRPFLGSGPATFPFVFTKNSPLSINQTPNWNIRFEQASNEYVNIISTLGFLGLASFLLILFFLLKPLILFSAKSGATSENPKVTFILASLIGFIVGSFFFDLSQVVGILFILLAASSFSALNDLGASGINKVSLKIVSLNAGAIKTFSAEEASSNNLASYVLFIPSVLLFAAVIFFAQVTHRAEVDYQRSVIAASENKAGETRDLLLSAIRTFGFRDVYHRTLSLVDLRIAQNLSRQGDQTEQTTTNIQLLVREAIDQAKIASGYQNPTAAGTSKANVTNWETAAIVYSNLIGAAQGAERHAEQTHLGAIARHPRNPLLYESLGKVYLRIGRSDDAIRVLETAVSLKSDVSSTHYTLAQAYRQSGDRPKDVSRELTAALNLLPEGPDKGRIQVELDEVEKELEASQENPPKTTPSAQPR